MGFLDLPAEVLHLILSDALAGSGASERIDQLLRFSLVSPTFGFIAQLELFLSPSLPSFDKFLRFAAALQSRPELGDAVQSLSIGGSSRLTGGWAGMEESLLNEALGRCRRVKMLVLSNVRFYPDGLRHLPDLQTLFVSQCRIRYSSTPSLRPYSLRLHTLTLSETNTPVESPFLALSNFPSLAHLSVQYLTEFPPPLMSRSLHQIAPRLETMTLKVTDPTLRTQFGCAPPSKTLWKFNSSDFRSFVLGIDMPSSAWVLKNIWYFPGRPEMKDMGGQLKEFCSVLRVNLEGLRDLERIYLAKEWELGEGDEKVVDGIAELREACEERGIRLMRDSSEGQMICDMFLKDMERVSN